MFTAILQVLSDAHVKKQRRTRSSLYHGGVTGTDDQQRYYRAFKEKHEGVTEWHKELQKEAVRKKVITLPSGRQYAFPTAKWTEWGTATNRTAICNYPVQGLRLLTFFLPLLFV